MKEIYGVKFLDTKEVSELIMVSELTVRNYAKQGILKARKVGKTWLFAESDIKKLLNIDTEIIKTVGVSESIVHTKSDCKKEMNEVIASETTKPNADKFLIDDLEVKLQILEKDIANIIINTYNLYVKSGKEFVMYGIINNNKDLIGVNYIEKDLISKDMFIIDNITYDIIEKHKNIFHKMITSTSYLLGQNSGNVLALSELLKQENYYQKIAKSLTNGL